MLTETDAIRRALLDATADDSCVGVIAWMHTFSPAKMWITGLDALRKPLLHLHTQANQALPWAEIDMDFMNLNQAAHGDREFAARADPDGRHRKTVTGHVDDPEVARRVGVWARAALGRAEMTRMRLARFGDNMRNVAVTEGDKVEAERRFGVSVNTWGVNDLVAVVDDVPDAEVDALCRVRRHATTSPRAAARRRPARVAAVRRPDRGRVCGRSSPTAASRRSPRTSRTSAGCGSSPASRYSG